MKEDLVLGNLNFWRVTTFTPLPIYTGQISLDMLLGPKAKLLVSTSSPNYLASRTAVILNTTFRRPDSVSVFRW
jgi:hypothetical protein